MNWDNFRQTYTFHLAQDLHQIEMSSAVIVKFLQNNI